MHETQLTLPGRQIENEDEDGEREDEDGRCESMMALVLDHGGSCAVTLIVAAEGTFT